MSWKKTFSYGYVIILILLAKSMRNLNFEVNFSFIFKLRKSVDLDTLGLRAYT